MEKDCNKQDSSEVKEMISKFDIQTKKEKEDKIESLIIDVIVSTTLKEYYETSNKISQIQPTRTE